MTETARDRVDHVVQHLINRRGIDENDALLVLSEVVHTEPFNGRALTMLVERDDVGMILVMEYLALSVPDES